ncbi:MAG: ABC transporter permease [Eubacteriaceae bacterium]|nr:ABC transporter permease [Eubacteriaceae bacterium]
MTFKAVIWKDWIVFLNKIASNTISAVVGPTLYLLAFGWGIGGQVSVAGQSYVSFVIPGIVAMNSMSVSFGIIASSLNISRLYDKTFEAEMMSPITPVAYTMAKVAVGIGRGIYCATLIIAVSLLFDRSLVLSPYFLLVLALNCAVFSIIGFIVGLLIKSHGDMAKVSNFVITPMSFLCGTLFPLDRFPVLLRALFEFLPLSMAVTGLRQGAAGPNSWVVPAVLAAWCLVLFPVAVNVCKKAE